MAKKSTEPSSLSEVTSFYPPVVAVLGHVDHGKTSLLDAIRKTSIADREFGGITQKIGTSTVEIDHEGKKRRITFIDTPGHAAFSQMRGRGANAADIGLLIIASNDGLMPQTKESISILKDANIPFIVVATKSDLPTKNVERTKQQLMSEEITLEEYGGEIPFIEVSSQTGSNIKELLELILLVQELHPSEIAISEKSPLKAVVIESKIDQKAGPRATIIIKNGSITPREELHVDSQTFKVRSLMDEHGKQLSYATIGDGVELLGISIVPEVGSIIVNTKEVQKEIIGPSLQRDMVYQARDTEVKLAIILCADTKGSLEAIIAALPKEITIVAQKTGEVSEADVLLAKSTGSFVVSFNLKIRPEVQKLATTEKVLAKNYNIIYEMIDELSDALEGKQLAQMEEIYGVAHILAKFPYEKTFAFGINVQDGRTAQRDKVRIVRGEEIITETSITSLRVGKNPTSKVEKGHEAGVTLAAPASLDIRVGDMIISHS